MVQKKADILEGVKSPLLLAQETGIRADEKKNLTFWERDP